VPYTLHIFKIFLVLFALYYYNRYVRNNFGISRAKFEEIVENMWQQVNKMRYLWITRYEGGDRNFFKNQPKKWR